MQRLIFTLLILISTTSGLQAQDYASQVRISPTGSDIYNIIRGRDLSSYVNSIQDDQGLHNLAIVRGRKSQTLQITTAIISHDGTVDARQRFFRTTPNGSFYGESEVNGAHQATLKVRAKKSQSPVMTVKASRYDDRPFQASVFQRSYMNNR